jgi:hypothetical protein
MKKIQHIELQFFNPKLWFEICLKNNPGTVFQIINHNNKYIFYITHLNCHWFFYLILQIVNRTISKILLTWSPAHSNTRWFDWLWPNLYWLFPFQACAIINHISFAFLLFLVTISPYWFLLLKHFRLSFRSFFQWLLWVPCFHRLKFYF